MGLAQIHRIISLFLTGLLLACASQPAGAPGGVSDLTLQREAVSPSTAQGQAQAANTPQWEISSAGTVVCNRNALLLKVALADGAFLKRELLCLNVESETDLVFSSQAQSWNTTLSQWEPIPACEALASGALKSFARKDLLVALRIFPWNSTQENCEALGQLKFTVEGRYQETSKSYEGSATDLSPIVLPLDPNSFPEGMPLVLVAPRN